MSSGGLPGVPIISNALDKQPGAGGVDDGPPRDYSPPHGYGGAFLGAHSGGKTCSLSRLQGCLAPLSRLQGCLSPLLGIKSPYSTLRLEWCAYLRCAGLLKKCGHCCRWKEGYTTLPC